MSEQEPKAPAQLKRVQRQMSFDVTKAESQESLTTAREAITPTSEESVSIPNYGSEEDAESPDHSSGLGETMSENPTGPNTESETTDLATDTTDKTSEEATRATFFISSSASLSCDSISPGEVSDRDQKVVGPILYVSAPTPDSDERTKISPESEISSDGKLSSTKTDPMETLKTSSDERTTASSGSISIPFFDSEGDSSSPARHSSGLGGEFTPEIVITPVGPEKLAADVYKISGEQYTRPTLYVPTPSPGPSKKPSDSGTEKEFQRPKRPGFYITPTPSPEECPAETTEIGTTEEQDQVSPVFGPSPTASPQVDMAAAGTSGAKDNEYFLQPVVRNTYAVLGRPTHSGIYDPTPTPSPEERSDKNTSAASSGSVYLQPVFHHRSDRLTPDESDTSIKPRHPTPPSELRVDTAASRTSKDEENYTRPKFYLSSSPSPTPSPDERAGSSVFSDPDNRGKFEMGACNTNLKGRDEYEMTTFGKATRTRETEEAATGFMPPTLRLRAAVSDEEGSSSSSIVSDEDDSSSNAGNVIFERTRTGVTGRYTRCSEGERTPSPQNTRQSTRCCFSRAEMCICCIFVVAIVGGFVGWFFSKAVELEQDRLFHLKSNSSDNETSFEENMTVAIQSPTHMPILSRKPRVINMDYLDREEPLGKQSAYDYFVPLGAAEQNTEADPTEYHVSTIMPLITEMSLVAKDPAMEEYEEALEMLKNMHELKITPVNGNYATRFSTPLTRLNETVGFKLLVSFVRQLGL